MFVVFRLLKLLFSANKCIDNKIKCVIYYKVYPQENKVNHGCSYLDIELRLAFKLTEYLLSLIHIKILILLHLLYLSVYIFFIFELDR